jgi:hypothetical protein
VRLELGLTRRSYYTGNQDLIQTLADASAIVQQCTFVLLALHSRGLIFFHQLERFAGQYPRGCSKGWQLCETRLAF